MSIQHGRDHDQRRFHNDGRTTRKRGRHAVDEEEQVPPSEPAPAAKLAAREGEEAATPPSAEGPPASSLAVGGEQPAPAPGARR